MLGIYIALNSTMCESLRDFDIQSRAAESIVGDWQGSILGADGSTPTPESEAATTRAVWTINELVTLLLRVVESARRVPEKCAEFNKGEAVEDGESARMVGTVRGFVASMRRLDRAIRTAIGIVDMFKSQGHSIARADELEKSPIELSQIIDKVIRFSEDVEWEDLNNQALPLAEFKELAAHLVKTGKASA